MLLKVNGVVRIARDVELKYLPSGKAVASFSVVSSDKYKGQDGEQKEETCFIECTVWGRLGEVINQYCKKGSQIYIDGKVKQENWTDQNGGKRSKHSVTIENMTMLDSKGDSQQPQGQYEQPAQEQASKPYTAPAGQQSNNVPEIDIDDEIPF